MFDATIIFIQDYSYTEKESGQYRMNYRVYFKLPDGQGVWLPMRHSKPTEGQKIKIGIRPQQYGDYRGQAELYVVE